MHTGFTTQSGSTTPRWRISSVRELTPEEKGDKHHAYINLLHPDGSDARGTASIKSGWEGMQEQPVITPTDKQSPEPAGNVPIFEGQKLWAEIDAEHSDRVSGMDNYHAYEIVFQYDDGIAIPAAPVTRGDDTDTAAPPILTPAVNDISEFMHNMDNLAQKPASLPAAEPEPEPETEADNAP